MSAAASNTGYRAIGDAERHRARPPDRTALALTDCAARLSLVTNRTQPLVRTLEKVFDITNVPEGGVVHHDKPGWAATPFRRRGSGRDPAVYGRVKPGDAVAAATQVGSTAGDGSNVH